MIPEGSALNHFLNNFLLNNISSYYYYYGWIAVSKTSNLHILSKNIYQLAKYN